MNKPLRIVTIGGGTGTYPVIQALHELTPNIIAIVAASDSGGSTGRIRDEFGFVPVGDLRQSLSALATDHSQQWISKLLLYRFNKGEGLKGHNLGNLLLTALQDMTGSTSQALDVAGDIFRLSGRVIPVTEDDVQLQIEYEDQTKSVGEHKLDAKAPTDKRIKKVTLVPHARLNPQVRNAINWAETVIIGPGDYYASLMAVLVTPGMKSALKKFKGDIVYIANLMTRATQTKHMTAKDHVEGIEKAIGRQLDMIIANRESIPPKILKAYQAEDEHPIVDDLGKAKRIIRAHLVNPVKALQSTTDTAHRSLLRHDVQKLKQVFAKEIF